MKKNGFTMVELVLTITLIGILFTLSALVLRQGLDSYAHISRRGSTLQAARYSLERMVRELRRCEDDPQHRIKSISNTQISFVDDQGQDTNFNLSGATLYRGNDKLLDNVTSLTFTGYTSNNGVTSSAPQLRRVRIHLVTTPPGQVAPLTFETDIFIRNYMYDTFQ